MRALLSHSRQPLPFPLPLEPLVATPTFFEKREGFQWSQVSTLPASAPSPCPSPSPELAATLAAPSQFLMNPNPNPN